MHYVWAENILDKTLQRKTKKKEKTQNTINTQVSQQVIVNHMVSVPLNLFSSLTFLKSWLTIAMNLKEHQTQNTQKIFLVLICFVFRYIALYQIFSHRSVIYMCVFGMVSVSAGSLTPRNIRRDSLRPSICGANENTYNDDTDNDGDESMEKVVQYVTLCGK